MRFFKILMRLFFAGIGAALIFLALYVTILRPWSLKMGATAEELNMTLHGDELIEKADFQYTQAITIDAPKDIVWAYLKQVGYKKAGWYNIDWINGLAVKDFFYEGGKSADRIIPELQDLKAGDTIHINPYVGFPVIELEDKGHMLMAAAEDGKTTVTWLFQLEEIDTDTTRLITRWKNLKLSEGFSGIIMNIISEVGGPLIQQPVMLRGLKKRAEAEYKNKN
ncbi:MAG: hypothetical protein ACOZCL_00335 [Bacillota bacterium]